MYLSVCHVLLLMPNLLQSTARWRRRNPSRQCAADSSVSRQERRGSPIPLPVSQNLFLFTIFPSDLRIELPAALAPDDGSSPSVAVLPTLRTMLLRTHIAKLAGRPVPKTKYKLIALLAPSPQQDVNGKKPLSALAPVGKALEVEVPPGEEGRELGFWGLGDGDGVRVVSV